jgi:hypothetical protein
LLLLCNKRVGEMAAKCTRKGPQPVRVAIFSCEKGGQWRVLSKNLVSMGHTGIAARSASALGRRLVGVGGEAHMLRADPFRMQAEIVLQRRENGLDLIGAERAADRQVF